VGDILLAINNVSLRGKTLSETIELLQNTDETVTLKISHNMKTNENKSQSQTKQSSKFQSSSQLMDQDGQIAHQQYCRECCLVSTTLVNSAMFVCFCNGFQSHFH
jgi:hypothetical protein